jgi:hypothetical protein
MSRLIPMHLHNTCFWFLAILLTCSMHSGRANGEATKSTLGMLATMGVAGAAGAKNAGAAGVSSAQRTASATATMNQVTAAIIAEDQERQQKLLDQEQSWAFLMLDNSFRAIHRQDFSGLEKLLDVI